MPSRALLAGMGERRTRWQPPPSCATEIARPRNVLACHATLSGASTHTAALSQQMDDALRDSEVLRECCCAFAVHFASMTVKWNFAQGPLTLKRLCTGAGTLRSSTTVQLIHLRLQIGNEIERFATVQPPASYYKVIFSPWHDAGIRGRYQLQQCLC